MDALTAHLAIIRIPGIGPRKLAKLVRNFGSPVNVLQAQPSEWRACGLSDAIIENLQQPDFSAVEADLRWAERPDQHILLAENSLFPKQLLTLPDPPSLLYVKGDPEVLSQPQLAIVGSRNPSPSGLQNAHEFAAHLANCGLVITSGMAIGIDAAAHQGALQTGGLSLAVCGTGLDRVYPGQHKALAHQLAEEGALVSEFPLGTKPIPGNFPRRNRIISGLSVGTLVVEAALRSGSLITARLALDQGREVFAIPGSIHNPLARGCHNLIRQGAKLVESSKDILEDLSSQLHIRPQASVDRAFSSNERADKDLPEQDPDYLLLLEKLGYDPVTTDTLVDRTGLPVETISSMLLLLELNGKVSSASGGRYMRTHNRELK